MMTEYRWLLPFTHGADDRAIETVIRTAEARGAMLVPVALITIPAGGWSPDARLVLIQQAKEFLQTVQHIAAQYRVLVECHEVFTPDVGKSIRQLIQDLHCNDLVMVISEQHGLLLPTKVVADLLSTVPTTLVLIRLPMQLPDRRTAHPVVRFFPWFHMFHRNQDHEVHSTTDTQMEAAKHRGAYT